MAALLIPQGMPWYASSQHGKARRGRALCKVNGCTDPSLRWLAKPNSRPIHSIGISLLAGILQEILQGDPWDPLQVLIIGSERLEYYGRLNLTKTASFKDTGAVFFSADERAELCERVLGKMLKIRNCDERVGEMGCPM